MTSRGFGTEALPPCGAACSMGGDPGAKTRIAQYETALSLCDLTFAQNLSSGKEHPPGRGYEPGWLRSSRRGGVSF